ncbi:MAG: hypothetical protein AAFZ15_05440 [Bacteroidota bacterium]
MLFIFYRLINQMTRKVAQRKFVVFIFGQSIISFEMNIKNTLIIFSLSILLASCKDDDSSISVPECILLTDQNSLPVGTFGECDQPLDQWTDLELTDSECNFLDFGDPLLGADNVDPVIERIVAFPNPVTNNSPLFMQVNAEQTQIISVKLAVVNKAGTVLNETRYIVPTNDYAEEVVLMENFEFYTPGEYYQVYVKAFIEGRSDAIFSTKGTILYCDVPSITNVEADCF